MKLPNAERAVVDIAKLRDYCLSRSHPRGRHKARMFASRLGFTEQDAALLLRSLMDAAVQGEAIPGEHDAYGRRYMIDFELTGPAGRAMVRSSWIVRAGEDFPRMTTCYVL